MFAMRHREEFKIDRRIKVVRFLHWVYRALSTRGRESWLAHQLCQVNRRAPGLHVNGW